MTHYRCSECGRTVETAEHQGSLAAWAMIGCEKKDCPLKKQFLEDTGRRFKIAGRFLLLALILLGVWLFVRIVFPHCATYYKSFIADRWKR